VLPDYEPLTGPAQDVANLMGAFPSALAHEARKAVAALPETRLPWTTFSVRVGDEAVSIPYRIYHNPSKVDWASLTQAQSELVECLLTRHHNGYVREEYLRTIVGYNRVWIPPFVIQLVGEYVIEILRVIRDNIISLNTSIYSEYLRSNPQFVDLIEQRVISYWNCYYRTRHREDYVGYVGFQVLDYFKALR